MCTAMTYRTNHHYFGRNLDLECSYGEQITITPRKFPFVFRRVQALPTHYAMIGVAHPTEVLPLYYEATNEKGLSMAGLNFPGLAVYQTPADHQDNLAPFECIPWILGQCATVREARSLLDRLHLIDLAFSETLPLTPLHWLLADREEAVVLEPTADGLQIYNNPVGVLTNSPAFPYHLTNLCQYAGLRTDSPENHFSFSLSPYSRGLGAFGLPGDFSSTSRFVKAAFLRQNSHSEPTETASVHQFFHLLQAVAMPRGSVKVGTKDEITVYSSCCNTDRGIYYYTTYENSMITAVDLHLENLDGRQLISYPFASHTGFQFQNKCTKNRGKN